MNQIGVYRIFLLYNKMFDGWEQPIFYSPVKIEIGWLQFWGFRADIFNLIQNLNTNTNSKLFLFVSFLQFQNILRTMPERKITKFLKKLFDILDKQEYYDIISWDNAGFTIIIKDQIRMDQEVIPMHFSLRKFSSFVRQLHLYNFHKTKSKANLLIFSNPLFQRQDRNLALLITRKRKTKSRPYPQKCSKGSQNTIALQGNLQVSEISQSLYQQKIDRMEQSIINITERQNAHRNEMLEKIDILELQIKKQQNQRALKKLDCVALKSYSKFEDLQNYYQEDRFDIFNML